MQKSNSLELLGISDADIDKFVESLNPADFSDDEYFGEIFRNEIVSDLRQKRIERNRLRKLANMDENDYTDDDVSFIIAKSGAVIERTDSGVPLLDKYAEHIRNFLYTYKDSAMEIDPSIDPSEEHVGPMAQDIEQVAPDCVKETEEGVKVVDGNRLALVNAGVIGDLTRRLLKLEEALGVR